MNPYLLKTNAEYKLAHACYWVARHQNDGEQMGKWIERMLEIECTYRPGERLSDAGGQ